MGNIVLRSASFFLSIVGALVLSPAAAVDVYKCKSSSGKMEYSDVPCAGVSSGKVRVNNTDFGNAGNVPEGDPNARALKILQSGRAREDALRDGSKKCSFSSFKVGDQKGKALAAEAKEECLRNLELKADGKPTSSDAYGAWKDHHEMTSNKRHSAATVAAANRAADAAQRAATASEWAAMDAQNKTYRCRPGIPGELECR